MDFRTLLLFIAVTILVLSCAVLLTQTAEAQEDMRWRGIDNWYTRKDQGEQYPYFAPDPAPDPVFESMHEDLDQVDSGCAFNLDCYEETQDEEIFCDD